MGKKLICFILLMASIHSAKSQIEGELLVGLTNVTTTEMNNITNMPIGALVFNTTESSVYHYDGSDWIKLQGNTLATVEEKTADYTLTANDNGKIFAFNNATEVVLNVPAGLPVGFNISVYQIGDGKVRFQEATGVSIKNRQLRFKTAGIDAGAGLVAIATNVFHLTGDLKK